MDDVLALPRPGVTPSHLWQVRDGAKHVVWPRPRSRAQHPVCPWRTRRGPYRTLSNSVVSPRKESDRLETGSATDGDDRIDSGTGGSGRSDSTCYIGPFLDGETPLASHSKTRPTFLARQRATGDGQRTLEGGSALFRSRTSTVLSVEASPDLLDIRISRCPDPKNLSWMKSRLRLKKRGGATPDPKSPLSPRVFPSSRHRPACRPRVTCWARRHIRRSPLIPGYRLK
jgi:hypothetical protein